MSSIKKYILVLSVFFSVTMKTFKNIFLLFIQMLKNAFLFGPEIIQEKIAISIIIFEKIATEIHKKYIRNLILDPVKIFIIWKKIIFFWLIRIPNPISKCSWLFQKSFFSDLILKDSYLTFPLSICTWFLKIRVWKIEFDFFV